MAQYKTTSVKINGVNTTINSGDIVKKDGIDYRFEWCTYQFERWANLSREPYFQQQNWEGGMNTADLLIKTANLNNHSYKEWLAAWKDKHFTTSFHISRSKVSDR